MVRKVKQGLRGLGMWTVVDARGTPILPHGKPFLAGLPVFPGQISAQKKPQKKNIVFQDG